jgi:hypothetical protein
MAKNLMHLLNVRLSLRPGGGLGLRRGSRPGTGAGRLVTAIRKNPLHLLRRLDSVRACS